MIDLRALATVAWIRALEAELGADEATDAEDEGAPEPTREVKLEGRAEYDDDDDDDGAVHASDDGGDDDAEPLKQDKKRVCPRQGPRPKKPTCVVPIRPVVTASSCSSGPLSWPSSSY